MSIMEKVAISKLSKYFARNEITYLVGNFAGSIYFSSLSDTEISNHG